MNTPNELSDDRLHVGSLVFRQATTADDPAVLAVIEDNDFKGRVSLLYTRRPSPTASLARDGAEADIMVTEEQTSGELIALSACLVNRLYVNGKPRRVGYLGSLRIRPSWLRQIIHMPKGYQFMLARHRDLEWFYTTILESNLPARRLLEKKRRHMPCYEFFGGYEVYALKTGGCRRLPGGFSFHKAGEQDLQALAAFLEAEGTKSQFYPVLDVPALKEGVRNPRFDDFYLLRNREQQIVAAGAVWDQQAYKQYIIEGFSGIYRVVFFFLGLLSLLGFPRIDKPGTVMNFFTLSCFAVKDRDPRLFKLLLGKIRRAARNYSYFVAGFFHTDPLKKVCRQLPHFVYKSRVYLVSGNPGQQRQQTNLDPERIPYFECGRL